MLILLALLIYTLAGSPYLSALTPLRPLARHFAKEYMPQELGSWSGV
jgi:hypothetical protein